MTALVLVRHLRNRAARIALLVALCHMGLVIMPTVALAAHHLQSGSAHVAAAEECTCEHEAGVMCPMHRRSAPRSIPAGAPRWCAVGDDSLFALAPVLGALVPPEQVQAALLTVPVVLAFPRASARLVPLDRPPDSPPPRA